MDLKARVYRLLCYGYSQRKIAIITGVTRQRISQITAELVKEKYIYAPDPRAKPRLYKPTDTPLPLKDTDVKQIRPGRKDGLTEVCRAHSIAFVLPLERPPVIPVPWSKTWVNKGTVYKQFSKIFDIGKITFRLIQGKKSSQIVFFLPEKYLTKSELKHYDRVIWRYINHVANWFQKKYACRLGLPRVYQKPEFAIPEDPEILFIGNRYNIHTEDSWVDESEGTPEWETNDIEIAKAKIESGERILSLEEKLDHLEKMFSSFENKISSFENKLNYLIDIFSKPSIPEDSELRGYS
ncbi:MAG: hypothetical protein QHH15_00575 [Candidatus Thermoplasmatota archaeon]|nr:hypothetical protein [Candidatus Thermoplasmatota archaeon]